MPILSRTLSLLAGLALAGSAAAADVTINDLRAHFATAVNYDDDIRGSGDHINANLDTFLLDVQYVRSLGALRSWGGLIYGGDLFYTSGSGHIPGVNLDTVAYGIDAYVGYAYALPERPVHVEVNPYIGYGSQNTELSAGSDTLDEDATLLQYGLRVAGYYTFATRTQVGLQLRFLFKSVSEPDLLAPDFEIASSGLSVGLGVGHRF